MYKLSRYWNRLAYLVIHIGRRMIWDQTGRNSVELRHLRDHEQTTEAILCERR